MVHLFYKNDDYFITMTCKFSTFMILRSYILCFCLFYFLRMNLMHWTISNVKLHSIALKCNKMYSDGWELVNFQFIIYPYVIPRICKLRQGFSLHIDSWRWRKFFSLFVIKWIINEFSQKIIAVMVIWISAFPQFSSWKAWISALRSCCKWEKKRFLLRKWRQ